MLMSSRKVLKTRQKTSAKTPMLSQREITFAILIGTHFARLHISGGSSEEEKFLNDQRNRKVV